jgi:Spy/CpxP family protein refolding chaperone
VIVCAFALVVAAAPYAHGQAIPHGQWWHRADLAKRLALTDEQKTKLDNIFRASADELIDLRGSVEKASIAVRGELDQPQINRDALRKAASRLSEAQGRLFDRELMMLVDMRGVLTTEQWANLRADLDRPRGGRGGDRPMQRPEH